jgi:hypothetical protein
MFRIPHCLDNQLTDGGIVVGPTHWSRSNPQKQFFSASGTHLSFLEPATFRIAAFFPKLFGLSNGDTVFSVT